MTKFGLLGEKLGHSYSPRIHNMLCDYEYKLYEKQGYELEDFFKKCPLGGFNVTIPYKKEVIKYLSYISDTAKKIGSVNTVVKTDKGFSGYNTDYYGFDCMVKSLGIDIKGKKVLVLGDGGAAQTVKYYLNNNNADKVVTISRKGENNYDNIDIHYDADIIVNCTPVGMYPNNGVSPVSLAGFTNLKGVLDLIYNPADTELILQAKAKNIPCINGLTMLVAQAKAAAELFTGSEIPDSKTDEIAEKLSKQMKNIALIGMPGCGKTTIGKLLAKKLDREFYDADLYLTEKYNMDIPTIFKNYGEDKFREMETEVLAELCKKSSAVISTGGGAVTIEQNYNIIRQNSNTIWIQRDNSLLDASGRPISQTSSADEIYKKRKPLYERFSHFSVINMGTPDECTEKIIRITEDC